MFEYSGERSADKRAFAGAYSAVFIFSLLVGFFGILTGASITYLVLKHGITTFTCSLGGILVVGLVFTNLYVAYLATHKALYELKSILQRLRQLLVDTGHDLATPVATVQARIQIVENELKLPADTHIDLQVVKTAIMDLTALISDLRLLANTETVSQSSDMEFVSMNDLITESIKELTSQANSRNQNFQFDDCSNATVVGDRNGLKRVITNLLTNAIRYGGEGRSVRIDLTSDKHYVKVSILSPGTLIPEQDIPHLFDRFYANDAHRQRDGIRSGLGLAIVRAIIDAHGGKVQVQTVDPDGNNFIFTVPKTPSRHPALDLIQ